MVIDTLEKLRYQLDNDQQLLQNQQLYLLFDSNIHSALSHTYFLLDDAPEYYPLFMGTHLEQHLNCSPYLVKATKNTFDFIEWFFTNSLQWGFLYFSCLSLEESLHHWQTTLFSKSMNNSEPIQDRNNHLLRIYDAKVLYAMIDNANLGETGYYELQHATKPCSSIYLQNSKNQWFQINTQEKENCVNQPRQSSFIQDISDAPMLHDTPCTTSDTITNTITNAIAQRCELAFWDMAPQLVEKFSTPARAYAIQQGIQIAIKARFIERDTMLDFLHLWLERGPISLAIKEHMRYLVDPSVTSKTKLNHLKENTPTKDSWNRSGGLPPNIIC